MKPRFKTTFAWEQAQILMQPILIRVVDNLRKTIEQSSWQGTYQEIELPYPGHQLLLTRDEYSIIIDIWHLCYQICFVDYPSLTDANPTDDYPVDIDLNLIDDTGEIDWQQLEDKTQRVITEVFNQLPNDK